MRTPASRARALRGRPQRCLRFRDRAQALMETAVMLPVLIAVFTGGFSISEQITAAHSVNIAVDEATRFAAQIGTDDYIAGSTTGCESSSTDPCDADDKVLNQIRPELAQISDITVTRIVIFEPGTCSPANSAPVAGSCPPDTSYVTSVNKGDVYDGSGNKVSGGCSSKGCYTLDLRITEPPLETSVGVYVLYTYNPPARVYSITMSSYSSYRLDPQLS